MHPMRCLIAKVGLPLFVAVAFSLGDPAVGTASAALIRPAASQSFPDLSGDIVGTQTYVYNSNTQTGTFQVNNTPTLLAIGPNAGGESFVNDLQSSSRTQMLQVTLDGNGHLVGNATNSFSVYGQVTIGTQTYSGLLLQGTPTQFGWAAQNPQTPTMSVFDVNMTLTGGVLMDRFGPDAYVRIITDADSTFSGSFTQSFSGLKALTNVRAYHAPSPVPEPTCFCVLLACGGAGILYRRRKLGVRDLTPEL